MKKNITQNLITFRKTPESISLTTAFNKEFMSKHSTELLINRKTITRNKRMFHFSKILNGVTSGQSWALGYFAEKKEIF